MVFKVKAGEGAAVSADAELQVYTTRPDTLFGVTYMVVAPEHSLLSQLTSSSQKADVEAYVDTARNKSDLERTGLQKDKTGVFTGKVCFPRMCLQRWPKPYGALQHAETFDKAVRHEQGNSLYSFKSQTMCSMLADRESLQTHMFEHMPMLDEPGFATTYQALIASCFMSLLCHENCQLLHFSSSV